jgi:hypothetical protein
VIFLGKSNKNSEVYDNTFFSKVSFVLEIIAPELYCIMIQKFKTNCFYNFFLCIVAVTARPAVQIPKFATSQIRFMGNVDDVVVPELVDTLEWVLNSPPNVHQFDEPPVSKLFQNIAFRCFKKLHLIILFSYYKSFHRLL